jgi:RimJ/RimL family protein N-acetyltransferase
MPPVRSPPPAACDRLCYHAAKPWGEELAVIRGAHIVLTALDPANVDTVRRWISDPDVNAWMVSGHVPVSRAAELAWYEAAERDVVAGTAYNFEIHATDDLRLIGHCGLTDVDRFDRHGEVGIVIGELADQGKGLGRDALVTLLRFAFETVGLNTVRIRAIAGNERALRMYRSVGFADVGVFREGRYVRGTFHNVALLDITRADYDEMYSE